MLPEYAREQLELASERYVLSLTAIGDIEKEELIERANLHAIFCDTWLELKKYIDGKEVEIILYGKMKPDPKAMDFGSFE